MVEWKDVAERVLPVAIVGGVTIFLLSKVVTPSPPGPTPPTPPTPPESEIAISKIEIK